MLLLVPIDFAVAWRYPGIVKHALVAGVVSYQTSARSQSHDAGLLYFMELQVA